MCTLIHKTSPVNGLIVNKKLFVLGMVFLLAGAAVYLFARPADSLSLSIQFPAFNTVLQNFPSLHIAYGSIAPSFFHPLAFSLLTMAFLLGRRERVVVCVIWLCIEALFEIGQYFGAVFVDSSSPYTSVIF